MATNNIFEEHTDVLDVVVLENPAKGIQYRLTISEFRETYYIGVREWYASFDNCFAPSNNGFSMPYTLHSCAALYQALLSLLTKAETLEEVRNARPFVAKAQALDALSLKTAIPAELLPELLHSSEVEHKSDEVTITIKLPRGSEWLN